MLNIDQTEIAKFNDSHRRWWDKNGDFKALHDINPLRLTFIQHYAPLAKQTVLDVGCGGGILSEGMAKRGAIVTGIDMNNSVLMAARQHASQSKITIDYHQSTAEALAEVMPAHFNIVTCLEMLEHVPNPDLIVQACTQLVKPQGAVFFSTINRNVKSYLHAIIGAEYILKLIPKGTHDYAKFIRPSELAKCARRAGLEVCALQGMHYNPITQEYYLVDDVSVNYLMYCKKDNFLK